MTPRALEKLDRELTSFVESLTAGMGRPERRSAMGLYITGLLLDGERKSIEPIAARLVDDIGEVQAMRQRLQQCVTVSGWRDDELFGRLAVKLDRELPGAEALVIDDTGFPKKGSHSVGVARQYSGTLGRVDNCQVATSLHLAGERGSGCIGMRIYLPETWTGDRGRCRSAGVPEDVSFQEKWRLALALLDNALAAGIRHHVVLADAAYGDCSEFRDELTARGLPYMLRVQGTHAVWPPGTSFQEPKRREPRGRPPKRLIATGGAPVSIAALAAQLSFRTISWRDGSRGRQSSKFAAVRIRTARRHSMGRPPGYEQWLVCEWPPTEDAPSKFYLSTLPHSISLRELVRVAKLRWRIERDYQEMKGELGLDHFEGRTWRGFHHHVALCAAAHAFLALRRALFPPEQDSMDPVARPAAPAANTAA